MREKEKSGTTVPHFSFPRIYFWGILFEISDFVFYSNNTGR